MTTIFSFWDWAILFFYIALVTGLGSRFYRRRSSAQDYFLGGRRMNAIPVAISLVAADLSAMSYMGVPAWAYEHNWQLFLQTCTLLLATPVVIYVFMPFYMRFRFYTGYEYLERRFDMKCRLLASSMFLLTRGGHIAVAIFAPSIALKVITGLPIYVCVLITGVFTTFYTTLGGMKAVIWTDVLQFAVLIGGAITVVGLALVRIPGGVSTVYHVSSQGGRLSLLNFSLDPKDLTSVWSLLIGGGIATLSTLGTDQAYLQRYFTTGSLKEGRLSVLLDALIALPVSMILFTMGDLLYTYYHFRPDRLQGLPMTDAILPFFVVHELGGIFSGLMIASIFAASMAVMGAGLNSMSTVTAIDFYQRLGGDSNRIVQVGRLSTVAWGGAATVAALFAGHLGPIVMGFNLILSYFGGPILGIFLLGMLTKRCTGRGAFLGAVLSLAGVTVTAFESHISFFYYAVLGFVGTFSIGYLLSLLEPAPHPDQIRGLVLGEKQ
jgi:SSS family transporter